MRLSRKSEYALLALVTLTKNYNSKLVTISDIAEENDIPQKFLEQILILLKQSGYVKSVRGPNGGYKLSKSPSEITTAEVFRSIDGPLASVVSVSLHFYEKSPIERCPKLKKLLKDIRDYASQRLENTTLRDLI
ncbi:MAG: Rrf2 family transcriptional regulator [Candidatus Cloacimonetes bacterium]|nr:Rrf2 family transcriptional regulator [Candidatus Cloacimonadota bacterium]